MEKYKNFEWRKKIDLHFFIIFTHIANLHFKERERVKKDK